MVLTQGQVLWWESCPPKPEIGSLVIYFAYSKSRRYSCLCTVSGREFTERTFCNEKYRTRIQSTQIICTLAVTYPQGTCRRSTTDPRPSLAALSSLTRPAETTAGGWVASDTVNGLGDKHSSPAPLPAGGPWQNWNQRRQRQLSAGDTDCPGLLARGTELGISL